MKNKLKSYAQTMMCFLGHHGVVDETEIVYVEDESSGWVEHERACVCIGCGKIWTSGDVVIVLG
jgi:hypothetical protein